MQLCAAIVTVVTLIGASTAFLSVDIQRDVPAGRNTTVTVVNDKNDATAVNYTVGLYTSVQNTPICFLIDSLPISATQFSVSIPPSVGPSGAYYRLFLLSFDSTGGSIFPAPTYTDLFFLENGTGVLSPYEIGDGSSIIGDVFYSSEFPCSAYDCARQCARVDPPTYEDGGLSVTGQTVYDSRYIACLEACPGVPNPLPSDPFGKTTTGTGPLPTVTPEASTVNETCNTAEGETPCGNPCCGKGQACWHWGRCEDADDGNNTASASITNYVSTQTPLTGSPTFTPPHTTSAATASSTPTRGMAQRKCASFSVISILTIMCCGFCLLDL